MFDEQVVRLDSRVKDVLGRFVCVRLVKANGLDLSLFQFDFDLTFAAFFMNADGTIYGRFGSRSDPKEATKDISLEGFQKALAAALELHQNYPANRAALAKKNPGPASVRHPEEYPSLRGRFSDRLNYEKNVAGSCIHCHMVRDAERAILREQRRPFSDEVTFPWPMPDVLGVEMDPKESARIKAASGLAYASGLRAGDEIVSLDGQPVISTADIQWVLEGKKDGETLSFVIKRGAEKMPFAFKLPPHWRRGGSIEWRATTWDLRRMTLGGMVLREATEAERSSIARDRMALAVEYLGQYGEHAAGKKAGFQKGDLIIGIDQNSERMTESQAIAYLARTRTKGEKAAFQVLRGGKEIELTLPMQ